MLQAAFPAEHVCARLQTPRLPSVRTDFARSSKQESDCSCHAIPIPSSRQRSRFTPSHIGKSGSQFLADVQREDPFLTDLFSNPPASRRNAPPSSGPGVHMLRFAQVGTFVGTTFSDEAVNAVKAQSTQAQAAPMGLTTSHRPQQSTPRRKSSLPGQQSLTPLQTPHGGEPLKAHRTQRASAQARAPSAPPTPTPPSATLDALTRSSIVPAPRGATITSASATAAPTAATARPSATVTAPHASQDSQAFDHQQTKSTQSAVARSRRSSSLMQQAVVEEEVSYRPSSSFTSWLDDVTHEETSFGEFLPQGIQQQQQQQHVTAKASSPKGTGAESAGAAAQALVSGNPGPAADLHAPVSGNPGSPATRIVAALTVLPQRKSGKQQQPPQQQRQRQDTVDQAAAEQLPAVIKQQQVKQKPALLSFYDLDQGYQGIDLDLNDLDLSLELDRSRPGAPSRGVRGSASQTPVSWSRAQGEGEGEAWTDFMESTTDKLYQSVLASITHRLDMIVQEGSTPAQGDLGNGGAQWSKGSEGNRKKRGGPARGLRQKADDQAE